MRLQHICPDKCEWMVGHKTMCTVQSHQMAKVVCQSRVSMQSWLGVVSFSIEKKIRKCLAEITCCEIGNWPLISNIQHLLVVSLPEEQFLAKSIDFFCGIGKSTVDDGSHADSSFTAGVSSYGILCAGRSIWGTDCTIPSSGYIDRFCVDIWMCR